MKIFIAIALLLIVLRLYLRSRIQSMYGEIPDISAEDRQRQEQEAARDQAVLEKLVVYRTLRDTIHEGMTLDEMIAAFEKMCDVSVGDPDDLLFETGTYRCSGEKRFFFDLVRQFQFLDNHEYVQLGLSVVYEPGAKTLGLPHIHWGNPTDGQFFDIVRNSRQYRAVKNAPMISVNVHIGRT